jgi:hypothetical protein
VNAATDTAKLRLLCAWCGRTMREAEPGGENGSVSHGICDSCAEREHANAKRTYVEKKATSITRLEFLASAEPVAHFTADGTSANRVADIFLGAQCMLYRGEGAQPTLSVSYFHRAYDGGAPEFDYGSPTNSFLALASADVKGFHYDGNVFFTELAQGPVRRGQFGQPLTISHSFMKRFTLSGEVWHFTQPFLRSNAVGNLWAISYTARKNLVFDLGFNHGLTNTSTSWEAFVGFTYLLPHRL